MKDIAILLDDRPGSFADLGEALGHSGVSIEGGGLFVVSGRAVAHFLFADPAAARQAVGTAGMTVLSEHDVLVQRLRQDRPGSARSRAGWPTPASTSR